MPHIPRVGRKSPKIRLLIAAIYAVLIIGAITTVYPFMVMLGSSVGSEYDQDQFTAFPAFLANEQALFGKFVCDKYNGDITTIDSEYDRTFARFADIVEPPRQVTEARLVARWRAFLLTLPAAYKVVGFAGTAAQYAPAPLLTRYREWLRKRFHDNIRTLDTAYTEEDTSFLGVFPPFERPQQRLYRPSNSVKEADWTLFKQSLPQVFSVPVLCDPLYRAYLQTEIYNGKIDQLNAAWKTTFTDWSQVTLPADPPANPGQFRDWAQFVRDKAPLRYVALDLSTAADWRRFIRGQAWAKGAGSLLPSPASLPEGNELLAYASFVRQVDPRRVHVQSTEVLWREQEDDPTAPLPLPQADLAYMRAHENALRFDFVVRNYAFALDYLLLHGDGVLNTVIYCGGAVLIALLVNPLCAYTLSRFRLPYAQSVLLFILATMAFPAEVTMIPNFLLLKDLNLLNTFWALILPGAASGFSIFLMKGFFDSLPRELYEAGMLDGASELNLFRRVTLPLSRPIFAVIALQSCVTAYSAFQFAMTVCKKQSHWTLMVWIYEFQTLSAPQYVVMAALVLAAIPTLLIFMLAQNVIMKGVILPSFK